MGIIKDQKIKIKWSHIIKNYYVSKGYKFTKLGDNFEVDFNDFNGPKSAKIKCTCDYCGNEFEKTYSKIKINQNTLYHAENKFCCNKCKYKK